MVELATHYKERKPLDTVQLIKDFFTSHGYTLEVTDLNQTEVGSWYCQVTVFKNGIKIGTTCGKGVDKEYCLASAHAELYERFCNNMFAMANPYWHKAIRKANQEQHGYYYDKNEKIFSYDEFIHENELIKRYINSNSHNSPKLKKIIVDFLTEKIYVGVPYTNIADETDKIYMHPRLATNLARSVGMCAGNTIHEALVQGISEILEMECEKHFFAEFDNTYVAVKSESIVSDKVQSMLSKLDELKYKVYILDLSYTFNVPVAMVVLLDPVHHLMNCHLGSSPVFDIAVERCITELYQGIGFLHENGKVPMPMRGITTESFYQISGNMIDGEYYPVEILDRLEYKDSYNKDVFLSTKVTNEEMIDFYIALSKKLGIKFYYRDNSLTDGVVALQILCDDRDSFAYRNAGEFDFDEMTIERIRYIFSLYSKLYQQIYNNEVEISLLLDIINIEKNMDEVDVYCCDIRLWNDFGVTNLMNSPMFGTLSNVLFRYQEPKEYPDCFTFSIFEEQFKKFIMLVKYLETQQYTREEIFVIFNNILNFNLTDDDIDYCDNPAYVLNKVYIKPLHNYLHSNDYKEVIQTYIK